MQLHTVYMCSKFHIRGTTNLKYMVPHSHIVHTQHMYILTAPTPFKLSLPSPPLPPTLSAVMSSRSLVPLTQLALLEGLLVLGVARRPLQRKVPGTHHSLLEC